LLNSQIDTCLTRNVLSNSLTPQY